MVFVPVPRPSSPPQCERLRNSVSGSSDGSSHFLTMEIFNWNTYIWFRSNLYHMHFLRRSHGYFLAFLLLFAVVPERSFSQGFCVQSSDFPGRRGPGVWLKRRSQRIPSGGFIAGGFYINDVWEYDELTSQWTQKDTFPGSVREALPGRSTGKSI